VDVEAGEPASDIDPHQVAEVIVDLPGGEVRRGSGYRVGRSAVLTAAHVVAGALTVPVRFDADPPVGWTCRAHDLVTDQRSDLAAVVIDPPPTARRPAEPCFGRIGPATAELAVQAVGFPRFKLKPYAAPGSPAVYRESHQAAGTVAPMSNRRAGNLEVTVRAPERDPDPETSPWEGMSGVVGRRPDHRRGHRSSSRRAGPAAGVSPGEPARRQRRDASLRSVLALPDGLDHLPDVAARPTGVRAARDVLSPPGPTPFSRRRPSS
jgi:hypothetical protein